MSGGSATARSLLLLRSVCLRTTTTPAKAWAACAASSSRRPDDADDDSGHERQPRGVFAAPREPSWPVSTLPSSSSSSSSPPSLLLPIGRRRHGALALAHGLAAGPLLSRGLTTTRPTTAADNNATSPQKTPLADVQGLLDSLSALRLRDELSAASDATPYVPHARLLEIVRETGAADTAAEAERVADALVRAGVVLRLGGVVYLRPHEVAEMVLASVPSDGAAAAGRLREIEGELEALDRAHADIVAQARRWPRFWLGAGCAAFAAQLAGFIYLCYWELSWDVVEPLACFVSMGWTLVAWLYFLARGSALDYDAFDSHWTQAGLEKRMAAHGFDPERHERLALARDRYRRYLSAQRSAARAEGVGEGEVVSSSSPLPPSSSAEATAP
jgi:hypothetical protein